MVYHTTVSSEPWLSRTTLKRSLNVSFFVFVFLAKNNFGSSEDSLTIEYTKDGLNKAILLPVDHMGAFVGDN